MRLFFSFVFFSLPIWAVGLNFSSFLSQESCLHSICLPSGITALIKESTSPLTSLRVIWEEATHHQAVYALDSQKIDQDQIERFFAYCKTHRGRKGADFKRGEIRVSSHGDLSLIPGDQMAIIAVGDFSEVELVALIERYFSHLPLHTSKWVDPLSTYVLPQGSKLRVELDYSLSKEGKTDLLSWWRALFCKHLIDRRLECCVRRLSSSWEHGRECFFLPSSGYFEVSPEKGNNALSFLFFEIEQMRREGFYLSEFEQIKNALLSKLQFLLASKDCPSSSHLASYYADQVLSERQVLLDYPSFLESSEQIVDSLLPEDIFSCLQETLSPSQERIRVGSPLDSPHIWKVEEIQALQRDIAAEMNVEDPRLPEEVEDFSLKSISSSFSKNPNYIPVNTDLFHHLPLTDQDRKYIHSIITTIADKNVFQLAFKKKELEKNGEKICHVHPLRFIGYIVSDSHLKHCLREIRRNSFKWDGFLKGSGSGKLRGFSNSMTEQSRHHNLEKYVPGFAQQVHENPHEVMKYIHSRDWEGLAKFLIR